MSAFTRFTNALGDWYRARGWKRVVVLVALAPLIVLSWLIWPFVSIYIAITWDGR